MLNEDFNHLLFTMLETYRKVKKECENKTFELEEKENSLNEEWEAVEMLRSLGGFILESRETLRDKFVEYLYTLEETPED